MDNFTLICKIKQIRYSQSISMHTNVLVLLLFIIHLDLHR